MDSFVYPSSDEVHRSQLPQYQWHWTWTLSNITFTTLNSECWNIHIFTESYLKKCLLKIKIMSLLIYPLRSVICAISYVTYMCVTFWVWIDEKCQCILRLTKKNIASTTIPNKIESIHPSTGWWDIQFFKYPRNNWNQFESSLSIIFLKNLYFRRSHIFGIVKSNLCQKIRRFLPQIVFRFRLEYSNRIAYFTFIYVILNSAFGFVYALFVDD